MNENTVANKLNEVMRLYNAARRNRDKGGRLKELFAGRCEGIAMTLSKLGYRLTCVNGKYVAKQSQKKP